MTSARDGREAGQGSRASDSAKCLLVVGSYVQNVHIVEPVVDRVKDRIEMSPSMVDFFEIRFVDMGVRPEPHEDVGPGVARLALEFTSRPGDAARNFSALIVVDGLWTAIDRVFRACLSNDVMSKLNVRYLGLPSDDNRRPPGSPPPPDGVRIFVPPKSQQQQPADRLATSIYRQAQALLHDFGSGDEQSVTGTSLNQIGSDAEPSLRRVIATSAKADEAAALREREARAMREAKIRQDALAQQRQAAAKRQAYEERQRAETRQRQGAEEQRLAELRRQREAEERKLAEVRQGLEAEERRLAEVQWRQEADRIPDEFDRRQEADRVTDEIRKKHEEQRRSEQQALSASQGETQDQPVIDAARPGQSPDTPDEPIEPQPEGNSQPRAGTADPQKGPTQPIRPPGPPAGQARQTGPADGPKHRPADSPKQPPAGSPKHRPADGPEHQPAEGSQQEESRNTGGLSAMLKSVFPEMLRTLGSAVNVPQPESRPEIVSVARVLHECAVALQENDNKRAKARIAALRDYADGGLTEAERLRCRDIVIRERMLRPGLASGHLGDHFYDLMLRLAFGRPFDYPQFCEVEKHIADFGRKGTWPHNRPVLEAIDRTRSTDVRVLALTRYHLGPGRLEKWFRSHDLDVHGLVIALAEGDWAIPEHGDNAFTVLRLYLDNIKRAEDRQAAAAALHEHGYLAGALYQRYGTNTTPQISELTPILRTAYPRGLAPADIVEVFTVSVSSPALVRAALRRVVAPEDRILVIREFTRELGEEYVNPEQEAQLLHLFLTDRGALSARSGAGLLTVRPRGRDHLGRG